MRVLINATGATGYVRTGFYMQLADDRPPLAEINNIAAMAGIPGYAQGGTVNAKLELPKVKLQIDANYDGTAETDLKHDRSLRKNGVQNDMTLYLVDA